MNKEDKEKNIKIIDTALEHLKPSTKIEIEKDLEKAEERNEKNIKEKKDKKSKQNLYLDKFLKKHNKNKIDLGDEKKRVAFDKDICMSLMSFREDFIPLLEIYNFLTNQEQCDVLKKHFFLKGNIEDESTNDEITEIPDEPVITINLKIIDLDKEYYSNVVKGVLNMINTNFDKTFMAHHFKSGFLLESNSDEYYKKNSDELKKSLTETIEDINRILAKDKLNKNNSIEKKIQKKDFISILIKASLEGEEVLLKIYEESKSNDDIISKINDLKENKYNKIIAYFDDYLKMNELNKIINTQNEQMEKLKTDNQALNVQMEKLKIDNQEQIEKLKTDNQEQIKKLDTQIKAQGDDINQLNHKVGYLEIILNALISRKVINHSINQILSKYKDSLEIIDKIIEKEGKMITIHYIKVKNDINNVPFKDCQRLIDLLFDKKDEYNNCVHFNEIEKPSFVGDVWETVINFIQLTKEEKVIFNKIITDDIKNSFKFSQKDIKIEL